MNAPTKRQPIPFGKYLLLDRVNIGGMAEVWRAKTFGAGGFERLVAIKRILPNIAEDEEFITMFIDEAKITVQLNHANIAQIFELANIANSYFIAMEYVSGKDMRAVFDRCRKRGEPAPIPLTCYVISKCCEGLDYAHRKKDGMGRDMNIVHRDVSPQNALLSYDGEVKVIDFGIAKAAGKATKTQAGILKGKFGYMSPEQIRGLPLDRRSDVFAIGVCLYEMLTGERLFVGDSDFSVLEKVRKVDVLPPSHFNRKIPDPLEKIVMKALAKDVDDRYSYGTDLANDLQKFLITNDLVFGQRDLAAFMKATFAEDFEKEKGRLQEYSEIKAPEGMALAAEVGFGVGHVPAPGHAAAAASAVTSAPIHGAPGGPPGVSPVTQTRAPGGGLPPMVRSVPNPSAPGGPPMLSPATAPPPVPRTNSLGAMPRLTAVAPMLTNAKDEHEATIVADGAGAFDDQTNPGPVNVNVRNRAHSGEVATDPLHAAQPRPGSMGNIPSFFDDAPPTDASVPSYGGGPPRFTPGGSYAPPVPYQSDTSPTLAPVQHQGGYRPPPPVPTQMGLEPVAPASNTKLIVAILGAALILAIGIVSAVLLTRGGGGGPHGLLMLDLPSEVAGKAQVVVNGKPLTEDDGSPIRMFPAMREVPAGKVSVLITAPGYEPLKETLDVREGNEFSELKQKLKKQK